jgi:hypothetical protein
LGFLRQNSRYRQQTFIAPVRLPGLLPLRVALPLRALSAHRRSSTLFDLLHMMPVISTLLACSV